ncbi:MAG: hypothetical protein C5B60_06885 [Chloroflexi bacterium]|nr:MAG: hypothetical protein C5B60_06885 [Chloroflexota bacterium]
MALVNFTASRSQGLMSVDNASLKFNAAPFLPPNIEMVAWDGDAGSGFVERNDRARMTEKISDLSDYLEMLDAWIANAANAPVWADASTASPTPLTEMQIRQIKSDIVDAVYTTKRLQPRWWGSYLYEATDEAIAHMTAAADVGSVESGDIVSVFNGNVLTYNAVPLSTMRNNWANIKEYEDPVQPGSDMLVTGGTLAPGQAGHQHPWNDKNVFTSLNPSSWNRPAAVDQQNYGRQFPVGGVDPNSILILWQPLAQWPDIPLEAPVDIIASVLRNALRELLRHRVVLAERRLAMRRYIANPANSIADVIAYDVSIGWPS